MITLRRELSNWTLDLAAGWNRFWFTPADPATLGLIRLLAGLMLLYTHCVWGLALNDFFGEHGWLAAPAVRKALGASATWSYLWLLDSPAKLWVGHVIGLVILAMFAAGLYSRVTAVLAFVVAASYVGRATGALFGLDQINLMLVTYLMLGPCGAAFSLDRWRERRAAGRPLPPAAPRVSANIAIRLIQLHLCVIYLYAGMGKLMGPAWWDGTAMWKAIANLEYQSLDMTWLADWPQLLNLLTHVTIFWELSYVALIWPRFTRPVMLTLAIPLHLGIAFCLGMTTFGLVMLIANLSFVPPRLVRALFNRRVALPETSTAAASRADAIVQRPSAAKNRQGAA